MWCDWLHPLTSTVRKSFKFFTKCKYVCTYFLWISAVMSAYVYTCIFFTSELVHTCTYLYIYVSVFACMHACIYLLYSNCYSLLLQARAVNLHREDLGRQLYYNPVPPRNTYNVHYGDTYNFYINDTRPQVNLWNTDQFNSIYERLSNLH